MIKNSIILFKMFDLVKKNLGIKLQLSILHFFAISNMASTHAEKKLPLLNLSLSPSILEDNGEALISFSSTFLSNGSDLTQRLVHRVDHLHRFYYPVETSPSFL
ncbi:hypothetical protein BpHYR1_019894 [Brachionus plicatilis]|uniref:Uncharacterized protein n=1 Tax=Brachionus plicatilis TaxID=10195 RepID=A0A3M7T965_BRAPC|nr:hypothetical protein BpHYR1_019894 [Brachionus plicatilis]